jgi:uncharacterized protein
LGIGVNKTWLPSKAHSPLTPIPNPQSLIPHMADSSFEKYLQLLHKIDRFGEALRRKYPRAMRCAPGCARCCVSGIRVWRIEHDSIHQRVIARSPKGDAAIPMAHVRDTKNCAHLTADNRCTIYEARPVVCRLWGLPIFIPKGHSAEWAGMAPTSDDDRTEGTLTCCELNFTSNPRLEELPLADALNAETVLTALAAINHVYCTERGLDPTERLPLEDVTRDS